MKSTFVKYIAGLVASAALVGATSANAALLLTTTGPDGPGINNAYEITQNGNVSDQQIVDALNAISPTLNLTTLPSSLFKNDVGGGNSGTLGGSYAVSYSPAVDPENATITFTGGFYFDTTQTTWLIAKDGTSHYVWNLTGLWNGTEEIQINGLWPAQGSFSHIEIGGTSSPDEIPGVPEPATVVAGALLLLPLGASAVRILRKNRAA